MKHHERGAEQAWRRDWRRRLFLSSIFDGRRSAQGLSHWSWTRCFTRSGVVGVWCYAVGRRVGVWCYAVCRRVVGERVAHACTDPRDILLADGLWHVAGMDHTYTYAERGSQ